MINTRVRKNFSCNIPLTIAPDEAIKRISNIEKWWGVTCEGSSEKLNDTFTVKMGGDSFFNMTVETLIPNKKVTWLVTNCYMPWYVDKKEWINSKLTFELSQNNEIPVLTFTHIGLTPEIECFKDCEFGWTHWITRSLLSYFTTGKGDFKQR